MLLQLRPEVSEFALLVIKAGIGVQVCKVLGLVLGDWLYADL